MWTNGSGDSGVDSGNQYFLKGEETAMSLSETARELLEILQWPRVGPVKAREIVVSAKSRDCSVIDAAKRLAPVPSQAEQQKAKNQSIAIIERCDELGIGIIGMMDAEYSSALARIADPPPILYVRGPVSILSKRAIAVVGTRKVSESGKKNAKMISRILVREGYVVVSGLALGVDACAHAGALEGEGLTIAVLAHGLHTVAPTTNRLLGEEIINKGGCLVSEHPPGVPPRPAEFVRRNRIQSGLSLGSIVVESDVEGGAMHQANFTRSQGRTLMTILAASDETRGDLNEAGARHLIASGAIPLRGTRDLLREVGRLTSPSSVQANEGTSTLF